MTTAMIVKARGASFRARAAVCLVATCAVSAISPAIAGAAGTTSQKKILGISVPATVKVHTTTTPATSTPASATPATSTPTSPPAATTPTATTPASGAQPGTVAPSTTTPASALPQTPSAPTPTTALPATTTPGGTPTTTRSGTTIVGVAHKASPRKTHLSTLAIALAALGALLLLGCLVWMLARWLALEPRWTVSLMHSLREATYRGSATWAEFSDWTRLGR